MAVGTLMAPLDGSIVSIALPSITAELHAALTTVEWVAAGYLLVISSLLLMWGRLADMYGHRPVYLAGFAVFALGSALCGAAPTVGWLIAFRMVQAVGAGMMMATGPAIVADSFAPSERPRALGINTMVVALGLALGPALGGFLTRHLGWRWIFYVNLPVAAAGILWAARVLPRRRRSAARGEPFDPWGALLLFAGLGAVLLAISQGERWGWASWATVGLLALGAVGLAAFVALEQRLSSPLVDLRLFRDRVFVLANVSGLLNFMAQFSVTFLMPFYLQNVLRLPADRAGLVMLGFPAALALSAPLAGVLAGRVSAPALAAAGMGVLCAGIWSMSRLSSHLGPGDLFLRLAVVGAGAGLFQTPNSDTVMGRVPRHRLGVAGGLWASMRNIGMVLGIALGAAVFAARAGSSVEEAAR
ncbi:MAG TPA: MFS transporter, partial [Limnochordales bacterium]